MDSNNLYLQNGSQVWVEKTLVKGVSHRADEKIGLGKVLWSPKKDKGGKDTYRLMREIKPGDIVLHLIDNDRISGISKVKTSYVETERYVNTEWDGEIYNVDLMDYMELKKPILKSEILSKNNEEKLLEISSKKGEKQLFYNIKLNLREGAYLTHGIPELISLINNIYFEKTGEYLPYIGENMEYKLETTDKNHNFINNDYPLNTILYGPPGTGKTYSVIEKAVEIIDGNISNNSREDIVTRYEELKEKGQIEFITFHQSYSYEDFIEGIKPILENSDDNSIEYQIEDGIFKKMVNKSIEPKDSGNFEEEYSKFVDYVREEGEIELTTLTQKKPFGVRINSKETAVAMPRTETATNMGITKEMLKDYVVNGHIRDWKPYTTAIGDYLTTNYNISVENTDNVHKKFVLIIDEINRGNISKIFGELITLIEDDKRLGTKNQITTILPYSKDTFGIPKNLYLLGTMNTADRSIALMDTALRRRFHFEELMPNPELLNGIIVKGINLKQMLEKLNERIEFLYDRDHEIGHAYFISLRDIENEEEQFKKLCEIFKNKIIPLLQEYFYDNYEKIQIVLGDHFRQLNRIDETENYEDIEIRFIQSKKFKEHSVIGFDHEEYEDIVTYRINPDLCVGEISPDTFKKIYEKI